MRPPVPQPSRVTPMAVPAQIGADFSCSGCNRARSANGRATIREYVSYPSKIHPRKLAASMRQCVGVRSAYQACDADRTEAKEFIKFLLPQAASQKKGRGSMSRCTAELPPLRICQNYGRLHLAFGNSPIPFEEPVFLLGTDHLKAVPLIEVDCPPRSLPRADQHRPACQRPQVG